MKEYRCYWSENYHNDFFGTLKSIQHCFNDIDPDEEEWIMWDCDGGFMGSVTLREFDQISEMNDKIECDNMTIKRIK